MIKNNLISSTKNKIGYIPGVFDCLHTGHIHLINRSLYLCKFLIIGIHTDNFVQSYKRCPKNNELKRKKDIIDKFGSDNIKVILVEGNHRNVINTFNINLIIHGDDWELESYKKKINYYKDKLYELNIQIQMLKYSRGISTTNILNKNFPNINNFKTFLFDLDNTLLINNKPMPFAVECIEKLEKNNKNIIVVSNNNKYTPLQLSLTLINHGIKINETNIFTSLTHINNYLNLNKKNKRKFIWGTTDAKKWLKMKGHNIVKTKPDVVILLYNNNFNYNDLTKLCNLCSVKPYICGNVDILYPDENNIFPDTGSIYQLILNCTKKKAEFICGKPSVNMINITDQTIMVGDNTLTDKIFAENLNIPFIHVSNKDIKSDISHLGIICDYIDFYS